MKRVCISIMENITKYINELPKLAIIANKNLWYFVEFRKECTS